jgi:DNA-binding response OmpR family regulator
MTAKSIDSKNILIVEDEDSLIFTLQDTLKSEGYQTSLAKNGKDAIEMVRNNGFDLLILDLMLPGIDGYEVCKKIRGMNYTIPVIMLTARDREVDKVTGLNIGADDYITKPFGVKELLARIESQLRRSNKYSANNNKPIRELDLGPVHINLQNGTVDHPDRGILELIPREIEIIRYLQKNVNKSVSRSEMLENVWHYSYNKDSRTVDVHISKLRSKIEPEPEKPSYLLTLHGVGYMLRD